MSLIFHQQDTCEDRDKGPCKGCRAKGHKAKSKCQLAIQPKVNSDWELVIVRSLLKFCITALEVGLEVAAVALDPALALVHREAPARALVLGPDHPALRVLQAPRREAQATSVASAVIPTVSDHQRRSAQSRRLTSHACTLAA